MCLCREETLWSVKEERDLVGDLEGSFCQQSGKGMSLGETVGRILLQKRDEQILSPGLVVQLVRSLSYIPKGCRFDSWSEHIPRLRVLSILDQSVHRRQRND